MRKYEDLFLAYWTAQAREIRVKKHLTQAKMAEALYMSARCYQKIEHGIHPPCSTTLALFLNQLPDQGILSFIRTFAQMVEKANSQEVA